MFSKVVEFDTWFVLHTKGQRVHFIHVEAGGEIFSGQKNIEEFNNEADAETRAISLGWEKPIEAKNQ